MTRQNQGCCDEEHSEWKEHETGGIPPVGSTSAQEGGGKDCHGEQRNGTYEEYVVWTCAVEIPSRDGDENLFPGVVDGYDPHHKKEDEPPGKGNPVSRRSYRF